MGFVPFGLVPRKHFISNQKGYDFVLNEIKYAKQKSLISKIINFLRRKNK